MTTARLRRRPQVGLAMIACLAWTEPLAAQTSTRIDCEKAVSTPELNWCAELELEAADRKLNDTYKRVIMKVAAADTITKPKREQWAGALREAQRRWIAFRDHDCGELIAHEWSGGTGMTGAMLGCRMSKTLARTKDLEERYLEN